MLGTGGPGALYADSVYPDAQAGSLGAALAAGAAARNLSESQLGIASRRPRWNLSGSYQQVLPRYYSTAADGTDAREFLADFFPSPEAMFVAQFRKGYEWPFDARKLDAYGSSCVDLLSYYESIVRGRRVFVDYRANPSYPGASFAVADLPAEVRDYLERSNALGATPVERLIAMNAPAYELFLKHGTDLARRAARDRRVPPARQRRAVRRHLVGVERKETYSRWARRTAPTACTVPAARRSTRARSGGFAPRR